MQRDWHQYVADFWHQHDIESGIENLLPAIRSALDYYFPLYNRIWKHAKPGSRLLEVGAGTAIFGMWLASMGYEVTQIDLDERVVKSALEHARVFNVPKERYRVLVGDGSKVAQTFADQKFDLSYSRGLIEHFPECDAIDVLQGMGSVSRKIVSIVPGKHMKVPRVDERPFTMRKLRELHERAGLKVIENFSFGDEPRWLRLYIPPILGRVVRRHFEIGSDVGVICLSKSHPPSARV